MYETVKVTRIKREVLAEKIASILREGIIQGKFIPGERLPEISLSQQLGVSRAPLREAFRILEKEGMIEIVLQKGARVKQFVAKDIESIYELRSVLDSLAVKLAIPTLQKEDIANLEKMLQQMETCVKKADFNSYRKINSEFHNFFYQKSNNQWLCNTYNNFTKHIMRLRYFSLSISDRVNQSYEEHEELLKAVKRKEFKEAEEIAKQHVKGAGKFVYRFFVENGNSDPRPRGRFIKE